MRYRLCSARANGNQRIYGYAGGHVAAYHFVSEQALEQALKPPQELKEAHEGPNGALWAEAQATRGPNLGPNGHRPVPSGQATQAL